jgi:hypothetical protein
MDKKRDREGNLKGTEKRGKKKEKKNGRNGV